MKLRHTLQDVIESILKLATSSGTNRELRDAKTANTCTNIAYGESRLLRFLGIDFDIMIMPDGDYEMIDYFRVEDVELIKNGEVNWKAYADETVDENHGWGDKELLIRDGEERR